MALNGTVTPAYDTRYPHRNRVLLDLAPPAGQSLLTARVSNGQDPAQTDTAQLTTGAPAANQNALPSDLGPGRGNWVADDLARIDILLNLISARAQGANGETAIVGHTEAIVAGNLVVTLHNRGAAVTGADDHIVVTARYEHSFNL